MISLHEMANLPPDEPRHLRVYHEDYGPVLWWTRPITEAPWVGSPLCSDWPGYHQWWTPLPPMPPKLCRERSTPTAHQGTDAMQGGDRNG